MTWHDIVRMLRDPMASLVILGLIPVLLFLASLRRKRLSYLLTDTRVLGVHEAVNRSRVRIYFDDVPVTDVHLLVITVNNWGNEAIRIDDFVRPLRFIWCEPARILT